jgi:hypothetical protein
MISKFTSLIALGLALCTVPLKAQLIEDFSSFESPQTQFFGDWSLTADPFAGSLVPVQGFAQGAGSYSFAGGTNYFESFVERSFDLPLSLVGSDRLELRLRLLEGNAAESLTVTLFDSSFSNSASAIFLASSFTQGSFSSAFSGLTFVPGFDLGSVSSFRISGNDPFGGAALAMELDHLEAGSGAPPLTAVPEPTTYGLCGAALMAGLGFLRRRRR